MKLNFKKLGNGTPIVILHGIFGSLDNWLTVGRQLADTYQVYLVDQRNHGKSPHDDEFTYEAMADDIKQFIEDENLENPVVVGHSMGGKVAMHFAVTYPNRLSKLVVVDIAPKYYPVHHQHILDAFHSVPLADLENRNQADEHMADVISEPGIRQFLLKNLDRTQNGYRWKLNLEVIEKNIEEVGKPLEKGVFEGPVLFIRGGKSDYVKKEDRDLIRKHFPSALIVTLDQAGHWVHAEQPDAMVETLKGFITNA